MRLIDIDALPDGCAWCRDALVEAINDAPTIDAVEVVRCRECKYQNKGENESESWNLCGFRPWLYIPTSDNHFCGYGERGEADDNTGSD